MNGPEDREHIRKPTESEPEIGGFEQELRVALQRVAAPEGFAERVMARAAATPVRIPQHTRAALGRWAQWRVWTAGALAAGVAIGYIGAERARERREQQRAAVVQRQFDEAMRVTSQALDHTRAQLARAGFRLSEADAPEGRPE